MCSSKDITNEIKESQKKLKEEITSMVDEKMTAFTSEMQATSEFISVQKNDLETLKRKNNIIIFNLQEVNNEKLIDSFPEFVESKLNVELKKEHINFIRRLGRTGSNKIRPILVSLVNWWKKQEIMKNKRLLKGTKVIIMHDLTETQRKESQTMREVVKQLKEDERRNVYIRNSKIFENGKPLQFNENDNEIRKRLLSPESQRDSGEGTSNQIVTTRKKVKTNTRISSRCAPKKILSKDNDDG